MKEPNAAGAAATAAPVVVAAGPAVVAELVMEKEGGMVDVPETEEFDTPLETGTDTLEGRTEIDVETGGAETVGRVEVPVVVLERDEELARVLVVLLVVLLPPPPPLPSWRMAACRKVSMLSFGPGLTIMTIP